jgi:archaemetzincin
MRYLEVFYTVPVEVKERVSLDKIPKWAQRTHPKWGDHQVLTKYVLNDLLKPKCPEDALAYLCFTAEDLYPDDGWNFVYGQASLSLRIGVWSIYRNGDPAESEEAYRLCLSRTLKVASHETGHILGFVHCIAHHCNMNGVNNRDEGDRAPFHFCPVCLRKLCWNLQVKPVDYLQGLEKFCREQEFLEEAERYQKARELLTTTDRK